MNLATHTTRGRNTWTAVLGLAALLLPLLTTPARAQVSSTPASPLFYPGESNSTANTGTGNVGPVPFSWLQFKQSFGLPGAPTVPQYPSYNPTNANAYTPNVNYSGDYIRSFLLGDYAAQEPPGGFNNFFDTILGLDSGLVAWTAPDVNYSAASVTPIVVDDDNTQNASTLTGATTSSTTIYGVAAADAGWGQVTTTSGAPNVLPSNIDNYYADSYERILAISRPENETVANNGTITFSGNASFFHWYPNVTTPGAYTVYAWFPSQNATTGASPILPQERHVTDAQYQILINNVVVQTTTVDQQSGGTWVPIGGPFNVPLQTGTFATGTVNGVTNVPSYTGTPSIEVRLNNTTVPNPLGADPNLLTTYIVADAIELRGEDGSTTRMLSSPVAVNKTDYPELFSGYSGYAGDSSITSTLYGGLHPEYQQAHLVLSGTNGATGTVTAGTAATPITDVFTGVYPVGGPGVSVNSPLNGGVRDPIDQLVYFTRDETIVSTTDPTAVQTVGAVYCVDGRNGNVVWRYPSSNPVTVNDTDTTNFTETGGTVATSATAYPPPNGGNYYSIAAVAAGGGGTFATWTLPLPTTGTPQTALYQVMVWNPVPASGEVRPTNAFYQVNGATCVLDQSQRNGEFVPLIDLNGNTTFTLTQGTSVVNLLNGVYAGTPPANAVVVANAVEFVPADSLGTIDSTPAIVRNMRVLTVPGASDKWETRTVVVVADNLGKVYALDAAGNEDGNDTLYDANGVPVSFNADGTVNPPAGVTYVLPYTPQHYGTTHVYWIWQPNPSSVTLIQHIVDNSSPATPTAGQPLFTVSGPPTDPYNPTGFTTTVTTPTATETNAYPPPNGSALTDTVIATPTAPTLPDFVTWSPNLPANTSTVNVYVWYPAVIAPGTPTTTAHYIVVDARGQQHPVTIDQSVNGGTWVSLGQYQFGPTTDPPPVPTAPNAAGQYALTPNTIVLDNTGSAADVGKTVYADAVRVDVIATSQLITPLAFQMCSPTVALKTTDTTVYTGLPAPPVNGPPTNDATIFIGNSNGVMYSLEGGGVFNTIIGTDIRRNGSLDQNTPTAGVNWWFSFGGMVSNFIDPNNPYENQVTLSTTYAPAYDPYDGPTDDLANPGVPAAQQSNPDGLLFFTTFTPQTTNDDGPTNQGYLFAVDAKYGPFGDGGDTGGQYTVADPTSRVGTQNFNHNPIPYWTFPDKFGGLRTDPSIYHNGVAPVATAKPQPLTLSFSYGATTVADHLVTSELPAVSTSGGPLLVPPANPVGDAAGSPLVYTASIASDAIPVNPGRRVYFGANDPNTPDPTGGRIYGIDPTTGKLDPNLPGSHLYPFIYPATAGTVAVNYTTLSPLANPNGDPNLIGVNDQATLDLVYNGYSGAGTNYNTSTTVPNAIGAFTDQDAATGYFVSTSPVAAPITYPTNAANLPGSVTTAIPNGPGIAADQTVQMLYMGDLSGYMHYVDLKGVPPTIGTNTEDLPRDVYDYQVGDNIISTPALLPNASGAGYTTPEPATPNPAVPSVGGALFVTTEGGNLVELEAFPTTDPTTSLTAVRLKDWTYSGPGGYSSPAVAAFNTTNVVTGGVDLGDSEWVYVGGDQGTCYGFTPNNTSANGGNGGGYAVPPGAPGNFVPPNDVAPPNTVPPNRNFIAQITSTPPPAAGGTIAYNAANGPPQNPSFDWGQTAYIEIFGVDQSNPTPAATYLTPKAIRLTFTLRPVGRAGRGLKTVNKVIDLQSQNNTTLPKGVYAISGTWPPTGITLTTSATATTAGTVVGPNVAVYAYQLGDGSGDPQTPGAKIQIANITEQVQYYDTSTPPKIVTVTLNGTSDAGALIRKAGGTGNGLNATAAIDQGTFSILNPLAVAGAARSLGSTGAGPAFTYYNTTLSPPTRYVSGTTNYFGGLGPFVGVDSTATFADTQAALSNGNSILATAPVGGTITTAAGTINSAVNTLAQIQQPKQFQVIVATGAGLISHGTTAEGSTPTQTDPPASNLRAGGISGNFSNPPTTGSGNDYGQALFNIADRSALGSINTPISRLRMNNPQVGWNDNTETGGGAEAVVNPLPWEQLPQAFYVSGRSSSPDYPDIPSSNTSIELIPRIHPQTGQVGANYSTAVDTSVAPGSDTFVTAADGTLAASDAGVGAMRILYPNAAMVHLAIPKYQPANLESYPQVEGGTTVLNTGIYGGILAPGVTHSDTTNQVASNVAEGYVARGEVFIDTRGNGRRDRTEAYRGVQVWAGVPADTSTSIAETTVDLGSLPAGFGLYGTTESTGAVAPINDTWSPLIPGTTSPSPYAAFFKPLTIINNGNVNLVNVHVDQRLAGTNAAGQTIAPYLPFASDTINSTYGLNYPQSIIPSSDFFTGAAPTVTTATVTGTQLLPLVRTNFDFFDSTVTWNGTAWQEAAASTNPLPQPQFDSLVPNSVLLNGTTLVTPGATLHKPRTGDPQGSVMTVPDTPHNNYSNVNGSFNVATAPYNGRPVISMAIPLGTPVGTYSQTVSAFEGYDPPSAAISPYVGPVYAGTPVTALSNWAPVNATTFPVNALTYNASAAQQTASDPGTTLRATVVETRLTDGSPLPVALSTFNNLGVQTVTNTSAVLPMIDATPPNSTYPQPTPNSNDIQPWAFYDASVGQYTLLWTSARNATTPALQQTDPYDLYGSSLASLIAPTNPITPTATALPSWWSAPASLTFPATPPTTPDVSASSNPSVVELGNGAANALWVKTLTQNNQQTYELHVASIGYNGSHQPQLSNEMKLLTRTQPIFGPRGTYLYAGTAGSLALSPLTVPPTSVSTTTPGDLAPGNTPLLVWSTRVGGRSQIFYWPVVKADPSAAGKVVITSGVLPLPADLRSAANPTAIARVVNVNGTTVSAVDVTYTGVSAVTGQSDVYTSRYLLTVNGDSPPSTTDAGAVTALTLTLTPSLPTTPLSPAPTTYIPAKPTMTELTVSDGQSGYQAPDTGWIRDTQAFELDAILQDVHTVVTTNASGHTTTTQTTSNRRFVPLIPSGLFAYLQANPNQTTYPHSRAPVYDRSSGQWIFTINWADLDTYYGNAGSGLSGLQGDLINYVNWLYQPTTAYTGTTLTNAPNLIVSTNPAAGTVRFGIPVPATSVTTTVRNATTTDSTNLVTFQIQVNPQAQRVTFRSNANVASVSFIDNTMKTNAGPYGPTSSGTVGQDVIASRYWYLYRKTGVGNGAAAATSSVLYYRTRRLTVVLNGPLQLTGSAAAPLGYYVTNLRVTTGSPVVDITGDVDVDWARGRLYFPAIPTANAPYGYDGQVVTVSYTYTDAAGSHPGTGNYAVSWQDEPQANDVAGTPPGEHVIPISNAVNESDPSAFLNPFAGVYDLNDTPHNPNHVSTAHSVWLFWSSSRNAGATNGSGADLYWETLDPPFEVAPGP